MFSSQVRIVRVAGMPMGADSATQKIILERELPGVAEICIVRCLEMVSN